MINKHRTTVKERTMKHTIVKCVRSTYIYNSAGQSIAAWSKAEGQVAISLGNSKGRHSFITMAGETFDAWRDRVKAEFGFVVGAKHKPGKA